MAKKKPFDRETARRNKDKALQLKVVITQRSALKLYQVAERAGMSDTHLSALLSGWPEITISRVADIIHGAPDVSVELARIAVGADRNGLVICRAPEVTAGAAESAGLGAIAATATMAAQVADDLRDGVYDARERARAIPIVDKAIEELQRLRVALESPAPAVAAVGGRR